MIESLSPQSTVIPNLGQSALAKQDEQEAPAVGRSFVSSRSDGVESQAGGTKRSPADTVNISAEAREVAKLEARDREVKTHEAAHAAVGGAYAGSPSLTYKKGPDGRSYATSGEVSIDISPVAGDPQATLQKAEIVRAAALAPAQPSAQDMRVASRASVMAAEARADIMAEVNAEKVVPTDDVSSEQDSSISEDALPEQSNSRF